MNRRHSTFDNRRPSVGFVRRLVSDESGVALVFVIAIFLFLFVLVLSVYSIGQAVREKEEIQNACDAAAHAGAVAQADTLSRMAVVNRAMSWNYVQMTKLQMDYITYNWLKVTCNKFAEDKEKCLRNTGLSEMLTQKAGYCFLPKALRYLLTLPLSDTDIFGLLHFHPYIDSSPVGHGIFVENWWNIPVDFWPPEFLHWPRKWTVLNCYHNIHNDGGNRISNYIGVRSGNDTEAEEIRINKYDLNDLCLHFRDGSRAGAPYGGDLDLVIGGKVERTAILSDLEGLYGGYGCPDLQAQIETCQNQAAVFSAMLHGLNDEMRKDVEAAVHRALVANLPRTPGEEPSKETLGDYLCFLSAGSSIAPREYETPDESDVAGASSAASYFSGLRNTEQDEMLFLNMADGLPAGSHVTLAEYFAGEDDTGLRGLGLDQWFIRCRPAESKFDGTGNTEGADTVGSDCGGESGVCVERDWVTPMPGIVRCYKNANYHDARSQAVLPPHDVHRGNYCFDGIGNAIDDIVGSVTSVIGNGISSMLGGVPVIGPWIGNKIGEVFSKGIGQIFSPVRGLLGENIVEPSCLNVRGAFPDTCAEIHESMALYADYEWAAAYWICWYKKQGFWPSGRVVECGHIPIPFGAMYGGATDNGYSAGSPFVWIREELKNFSGDPKGHSRNSFRTECMFIDGEPWRKPGCESEFVTMNNGHGANVGIKSYVRVYGDDRDAYEPEYYCGAPSMPWILNENFFNGGGTIIVGLAKKRRNVFEALVADDIGDKSLHSAFSPPAGSHVVAFAAGRAAYAPRNGLLTAAGDDTANASGGIRYDLHYDASCKTLHPKLMRGDNPSAEWRAQAAKLEADPFRIGCVCTDDSGNRPSTAKVAQTANRLRRQWNLCQTDWDGVLLQLRFGRGAFREYNANPTGNRPMPATGDASPEWGPFASDYGDDDAVFSLAQILENLDSSTEDENSPRWLPLDGSDGSSALSELLDSAGPSDPVEITEAFRRRRIL